MERAFLEKVLLKYLESGNEFALFLILVILVVIVETSALITMFYLISKEKNLRISDRDNFQEKLQKQAEQSQKDKERTTRQLSEKNECLEGKIDKKEENFQELMRQQIIYLEQMKNTLNGFITSNKDLERSVNELKCLFQHLFRGGGDKNVYK